MYLDDKMLKDSINKYRSNKKWESHTGLCDIMTKFGSDKGSDWHNYTTLYEHIFSGSFKTNALNIFELGLGTNDITMKSNMGPNGKPGASIYGWREYFPKANIFGADIDKKILFESDRIKTFYCDQTNPNIIKDMWDHPSLKDIEFDLIVDDGLHTFEANKCFLENSIHKLKNNGIYIIEDILNGELPMFESLDLQNYSYSTIIRLPHYRNIYDNNVLIIQK